MCVSNDKPKGREVSHLRPEAISCFMESAQRVGCVPEAHVTRIQPASVCAGDWHQASLFLIEPEILFLILREKKKTIIPHLLGTISQNVLLDNMVKITSRNVVVLTGATCYGTSLYFKPKIVPKTFLWTSGSVF